MRHFACLSVHMSRGATVRGPCKHNNFILKRPFFTRFALSHHGAHRKISENIDIDLADAMDRQSLWGTGREV